MRFQGPFAYIEAKNIPDRLETVRAHIEQEIFYRDQSPQSFVRGCVAAIKAWDIVHPFLAGNGPVFMRCVMQLAEKAGLSFDKSVVTRQEWRQARNQAT